MDKKIWFISGISSGLGKALAHSVFEDGGFVIGTFRNAQQTNAFNKEYNGKGLAFTLDITQTAAIEIVVEQVNHQIGRLDVLVNNAGFGMAGAIEETSMDEARAIFEANFFGTLKLTQTFLPLLRKQQSGQIIQISSHGGFKAFPGFGIYNASKFALEGFSEALAAEIAPLGIKLTIVEPGPLRTNFAGDAFMEAATIIEDYHATAGVFRTRIKEVDGKQEGDPIKAAQAIIDITKHASPPLRLPLGKIAVASLQAKLDSVKNELDAFRQVAEEVVF